MNDDVSEKVLSHYGIKGMRWGVRNDDSPEAVARRQKIVRNTAFLAAGIGVTAIMVYGKRGSLKPPSGKISLPSVNKLIGAKGSASLKDINKISGPARINGAIPMGRPKGSSPAAATKKFASNNSDWVKNFTAKHNKTLEAANKDLLDGYNRLGTPFPQREFLTLWKD